MRIVAISIQSIPRVPNPQIPDPKETAPGLPDAEKALIVGTWVFEKFEFPNFVAPDSKQATDANRASCICP